jgi:outer membrane protein assembly factor BamB
VRILRIIRHLAVSWSRDLFVLLLLSEGESMSALRRCLAGLCLVLLPACGGGSSGISDGGVSDGGISDGGVSDGGVSDGGGNGPDPGSGLTLTLSPSRLSIRQFQGRMQPLRVEASVQGRVSGPVEAVIVDSAGVLRPHVDIQQVSSGVYQASLNTQPGLGLGQHRGTLQIRLCSDASCRQQYTQAALPYDITVLNEFETQLSPLSPWTGVSDWTTFQGDATHRGHVPVQVDPARLTQRWLWRDTNPVLDPTSTLVYQPISVAADGTAYLMSLQSNGSESGSVLYAINEADGSQRWSADLGDTQASAPTVAAGQVYFLTAEGSGGRFWAIEARTGRTTLQASIPLTQGSYGPAQPLIAEQKAYISFGGDASKTLALDASTGAVLWSAASGGGYRVTPAIDGQRLYFFRPYWSNSTQGHDKNFGFTALDLATGGTEFTIVKPPNPPNVEYRGSTPVLTGNGRALVNRHPGSYSGLDCVDLERQTLAWELEGGFSGVPTVVGETFYIVSYFANQLEARSVADGHLLWSWSPSQGVSERFTFFDIVATNNLVFFSTDQQVYALDVEKRSIVWSYPAPGSLSVSASGILYIVRYARNGSGNLDVEGHVAAINLH